MRNSEEKSETSSNAEIRNLQTSTAVSGVSRFPDSNWFRLSDFGFSISWRLGVSVLLLLLPGCASVKEQSSSAAQTARVWPPVPAEPRVMYVQSISGPRDLGIKSSGLSRFAKWLTGRRSSEAFNKPFGLAVDETGNLCMTDTAEAAVFYFDRTRKRFDRWQKIGRIQFVSPVAIAKRDGRFFVADSGLGKVLVFDEQARLLFEIKEGLTRPSGLAVSGGKLFVADAPSHSVVIFDLTGKFLSRFGRRGAGPGEFNFPTHISAHPDGRLLVTDSMNSRVELFEPSGQYDAAIGSAGDASGHFSRPKGVAVDSAGRLYVVDALFDNLQVFDAGGRFLLDLGQSGSAPGEFWMPNGIAISRDNQIFITDSYNHRIQVFKYVGPQ